jgi:transposase-like protein
MTATPPDLTLDQINTQFSTDETARAYLEAVRWPNGPVCAHCGNSAPGTIYDIAANPAKKVRAGLRECKACGEQFTVTVGTIFEKSKIPLRKWLIAWYLLCTSKKGISAHQIMRMLDIGSYRSAWFMMHRIRYALRDPVFADKLGEGGGTVEADETYIGGKPRRRNRDVASASNRGKKWEGSGRSTKKTPVMALVERGGRVRSQTVKNATSKTIKKVLKEHLDPSAHLITDEWKAYKGPAKDFASHSTVNHGEYEYVRGTTHTNTIEGYFSLFKRGLHGTFHHVGTHYLDQYLAEFDFRYSNRHVNDGQRTVAGLQKVEGKRLMLRPGKAN